MISALEAKKMLTSGCMGFLANIGDKNQETNLKPENIVIVRNFMDVFPEDITGLPLEREISFEIKLIPSSTPVLKAPYGMVARMVAQRFHPPKLFPLILCENRPFKAFIKKNIIFHIKKYGKKKNPPKDN